MSLIEAFLKYKFYFKDLKYHVTDFKETKTRATNITVDSVSIYFQEKKVGIKTKKDNCQVNTFDKNEANKGMEENGSEQK